MPAAIIRSSIWGERDAGPMVATIFVERTNDFLTTSCKQLVTKTPLLAKLGCGGLLTD
jgi:hypothetical protein